MADQTAEAIQRIIDPFGRLADVHNGTGAKMSAGTYDYIRGAQDILRGLQDKLRKNNCK